MQLRHRRARVQPERLVERFDGALAIALRQIRLAKAVLRFRRSRIGDRRCDQLLNCVIHLALGQQESAFQHEGRDVLTLPLEDAVHALVRLQPALLVEVHPRKAKFRSGPHRRIGDEPLEYRQRILAPVHEQVVVGERQLS